jgi:hypothetical protein
MALFRTELVNTAAPPVSSMQLLAVSPLLMLFAGTLVVVGGWIVGAKPFWPVTNLTLSEAVVTRDAGEVVRLIERERVDPNHSWPVRAELLETSPITPVEAAVATRRGEMVVLLLRHGAVLPEGPERDALICQAVRAREEEVVGLLLQTGNGSDPRGRCASASSAR